MSEDDDEKKERQHPLSPDHDHEEKKIPSLMDLPPVQINFGDGLLPTPDRMRMAAPLVFNIFSIWISKFFLARHMLFDIKLRF